MGHGQEVPSQHALGPGQEPLSQHAMGHSEEPLSQHAVGPGQEPLSQHALGHSEEPLSQHAVGPGQEPLSQHALGHSEEPLSQHAVGHGQEPLSQHAVEHSEEPLSQHALGHGQEPLSQHAVGHSEEPLSQHALGHGQELLSQHAVGHSEEPLSQHALGHSEEPLSQHALGHGQEPLSQHAVGHSEEPLSQHAVGPGQEPLSQHAVGHSEEPLSQHAAGARRVLFADALGLPLTRLRHYQPWPPPSPEWPPEVLPPAGQPPFAPYLLPAFVLPPAGQGEPERLVRLRRTMVELEEVLAPGPGEPWLLRGTVRVLNVAYRKAVHVRASRDRWRTYRDHPARYVPGGSPDGGLSDRFTFSLPFGPDQQEEQGEEEEEGDEARLDFVIRYQTDEGVYWANNQGKNYSVVMKGRAPPRAPPSTAGQDGAGRQLKSCMRPERMRPCEEELSDEDIPNPAREEEGSPERETQRESPSASTGQVPELPVPPTSLETELPARELPVPLAESPGGGRGPEAGSLGPGASFSEAGLAEQAGLWRAEEEAVDSELEQLYLSHLSRLRAEELGGAGGQPGGTEAAGSPPAWLPALRLSVLSDRDLVVGWAGPERALNSSLAQEITLRYASPAARLSPPACPGRDSPPALLEAGLRGAGPGGALRLLAPAAVVVPAWTAAPAGRSQGGWGGPGVPREGAPGCPTRLGQALTRSLFVLGLVVILPVVLSGCLPAAAVTLYVVLTWRQPPLL
ncbi:protein phosphatase 1 regulatory subunit 3F isoform X2 [Malaclemys terrapin pileata]|uniref:protein phosphatase 1 regulatory subunit 3F isoform X2 n=1 Tax=Malaclemys terrapin pileata TaxID=2991368 RepID=UPI0023A8D1C6|nr:protein phosphatase 1 regulatory subunit 3F isoform X2 [Malaclemys terrapin pileata]